MVTSGLLIKTPLKKISRQKRNEPADVKQIGSVYICVGCNLGGNTYVMKKEDSGVLLGCSGLRIQHVTVVARVAAGAQVQTLAQELPHPTVCQEKKKELVSNQQCQMLLRG